MAMTEPVTQTDNSIEEGGNSNQAPAGYQPTTTQQRSDWNLFLDNLKNQGDVDLNDPQAGGNLLKKYKLNNPSFSVTPELLPFIQYEQQQIRTGDTFNNLNADQLKRARQGLTSNFLNEKNVYQSYYPQFKSAGTDFGTDLESYVGGGSK